MLTINLVSVTLAIIFPIIPLKKLFAIPEVRGW